MCNFTRAPFSFFYRYFLNPESVSSHLFCSICQDVFNQPYRAPCGHSFCKAVSDGNTHSIVKVKLFMTIIVLEKSISYWLHAQSPKSNYSLKYFLNQKTRLSSPLTGNLGEIFFFCICFLLF